MVLIVESDLAYAERLRIALQRQGIPVHTVTDGLEALRWLRTTSPHLILVDQSAFWIDAFHLCRLTKFHKRQGKIPVLIMSRVVDDEHRRLASEVKADGYIEKKRDAEAVVQEVTRILASSSGSSSKETGNIP